MTYLWEITTRILLESGSLFRQMAPYLLMGFAANALVALLVPERWISRHLGQPGFKGVLWATLIGIPLPLCSCSVLPMALGLRARGASIGATIAFLIATPQTGVDSILVTGQLIGWPFAFFKVVAALVTGLAAGWLAERLVAPKSAATENLPPAAAPEALSTAADEPLPSWRVRFQRALAVGFLDFPASLGGALMLGIVVGGALTALVPSDFLTNSSTGSKLLTMLAMLAMAVPMYVCSTGSVPMAAGFHHMGVSQGTLLVFLMAGPATNIAEISVIYKRMGWKALSVFLGVIVVASMALGIAFEEFSGLIDFGSMPHGAMTGHEHHAMESAGATPAAAPVSALAEALDWAMLLALAGLLLFPLVRKLWTEFVDPKKEMTVMAETKSGAQTYEFDLSGLNCEHCIRSTKNSLEGLPGLESITVNLKKAVLRGKDLKVADVLARVKQQGFEAKLAPSEITGPA